MAKFRANALWRRSGDCDLVGSVSWGGCMWGSRIALSLCSLILVGVLSAQTPAEGRLRQGCAADLAAELRALSWAGAAEQRNAARPQKRGHRPPRRGARQQRQQLSVSPDHRGTPTACRCRPPVRSARNKSTPSKRGSTRAPTGRTRSPTKPNLPPLNPKAVAMVEALHAGDLHGVHEVRRPKIRSFSTRADRRVPRHSCTRCSTPARPRWNAC